jgi:peptidylprolyl isomerase/FK506-binding protein 1
MGLEKQTLRMGNGKDHPQPGDPVELNYTGYLYDESNPDHHKGKEYVHTTVTEHLSRSES